MSSKLTNVSQSLTDQADKVNKGLKSMTYASVFMRSIVCAFVFF